MSSSRRVVVLVIAAVAAFASVASAHDTWLLPSAMQASVGRALVLDLTSGMLFPNDDFAIAANRVKRTVVRLAGNTKALPAPEAASKSLRYRWTPTVPGIAAIGVELVPKTLTLEPDKIEEYLGEIDANTELRHTWATVSGKRPWVESYSKHATTFVRVGSSSSDSGWSKPLGLALEIVPLRDPTALRVGDTLAVQVLRGGRPIAGFSVGAIREGKDSAAFSKTDAAGRALVPLRFAGRLLLNGTHLRRSANPAFVWESDFVTLTVSVGPSQRR